jgi:O-antigen/teichoic acid export membrane protein
VALNAVIQGVGDVGGKVAMFALYAAMARIAGRDDFGDFTSAGSLALFVLIATFGMDYTLTRRVAQRSSASAETFWSALTAKVVLGIVGVVSVVAVAMAGDYADQVLWATFVLGIASVVDLATMSLQAVFRGIERFEPIATGTILQRVLTAVAGIAVMLAGGRVVAVSVVWLGGSLVAFAYAAIRLRGAAPILPVSVSARGIRDVLVDSFGLGLSAVFGGALSRIDVVILGLLTTSGSVALYGAAYRLFESTFIITAALTMSSFPVLSRLTRDSRPTIGTAVQSVLQVVAIATVPVTMGMIVAARDLARVLYGPEFTSAEHAIVLLAPGVVLYGLFTAMSFALAAQGRQRAVATGLAVGAVVNVALNLTLVPGHAERGAATAMTLSLVASLLVLAGDTVRVAGPLSVMRIIAAPAAGAGAMAAVGKVAGWGLIGAIPGVIAYGAVLVVVAHSLFPEDLRVISRVLRRQPAVT